MSITNRIQSLGLRLSTLVVYTLLLAPVVVIVLTSFPVSEFPRIPQQGISLRWYAAILENNDLIAALQTSFFVATVASIGSGILGSVTAYGFVRGEFPYKESLSTFMLLPLMISPVITGIALIRFSTDILNMQNGLSRMVFAHVFLTFPYVFLLVRAELVTFDERVEQASRVLGANGTETIANVTIPLIFPSILSSMIISFVVSFGEFTATQFLVTFDSVTVPVIIYTMRREGLTPEISALSTVLILVMLAGVVVSQKIE